MIHPGINNRVFRLYHQPEDFSVKVPCRLCEKVPEFVLFKVLKERVLQCYLTITIISLLHIMLQVRVIIILIIRQIFDILSHLILQRCDVIGELITCNGNGNNPITLWAWMLFAVETIR